MAGENGKPAKVREGGNAKSAQKTQVQSNAYTFEVSTNEKESSLAIKENPAHSQMETNENNKSDKSKIDTSRHERMSNVTEELCKDLKSKET